MQKRAHNIANRAQRSGRITPRPCIICDASKAEKHHPDYAQPLHIIWVCRRCHAGIHKHYRDR